MSNFENVILNGDALEMLKQVPDKSIHCCVTSPPYWGLRDYGVENQLGQEETPQEYVKKLVAIFREVWRVLRDDGTLWVNLGDTYAANRPSGAVVPTNTRNKNGHYGKMTVPEGLKPKDLIGIPWRVAFALQDDGWYLRSDIIWNKPNAMPESVKDRPTKAHEYIFLLSKSPTYYYDADAIKEPTKRPGDIQTFGARKGREYKPTKNDPNYRNGKEQWGRTICTGDKKNKRTVWNVSTKPYKGAHFAVYPPELITPCILAGCPEGGIVLDPFFGSGTTGQAAIQNNRKYLGVELNPEYVELAKRRIEQAQPQLQQEQTIVIGNKVFTQMSLFNYGEVAK
jgi:DNA modification methylase